MRVLACAGDTLATAGDKGEVVLWQLHNGPRGNLEGDGKRVWVMGHGVGMCGFGRRACVFGRVCG
jgi:hypothetical protein